jgi:CotS family spore coat protein
MKLCRSYEVKSENLPADDDNYKPRLSRPKYTLKHIDASEWEITSAAAVLEYVSSRGFKSIISIKRDGDSKPYIKNGDKIYALIRVIDGQKLKLRTKENGIRLAQTLGDFHNAAENFMQPPGVKLKVDWGKRMEKYRTLTSRLERYIDYLDEREKLNDFEEFTLGYVEMLLKRAKLSMKVLRSLGYLKALESSMKRKEICLNSVSSNTAVLYRSKVIITKIFDIGYNMVEEDLASLIKKLIEETGDRTVFVDIINAYKDKRNLNEDSEAIIKALISYPFDSIKMIARYFQHGKNDEDNPIYDACLLEKFKKYIEKEMLTDVMGV